MTPKFVVDMKQAPKGPKHGNRKASPPAYGNPTDGASNGAGRADAADAIYGFTRNVSWSPYAIPDDFALANAGEAARIAAELKAMQDEMVAQMLALPNPDFSLLRRPLNLPTVLTTGEITAYRMWMVARSGHLHSVTATEVKWDPDKPMQGDVDRFDMFSSIRLGVYAFKTREKLDKELQECLRYYRHRGAVPNGFIGIVFGTVKLWGQVVEHEEGYRAEFARPTGILHQLYRYLPDRWPENIYRIPGPNS